MRDYFQDWSVYFAAAKYVDRSLEYINRSQPHQCGNWDGGRAIPRKGIHKWDFRCSAQTPTPPHEAVTVSGYTLQYIHLQYLQTMAGRKIEFV